MKRTTETEPFVAVPVRGFVEAKDPYELAVIVALQFWHWWKGNDQDGLGPEGVAAMTLMSESKAKAVLNVLDTRGWVEKQSGRRDLGQRTRYRVTLDPMDFKTAYKAMTIRLPQSWMVGGQLALTEPDGGGASGLLVPSLEPPQSRTNNKRSDLKDSDSKPTAAKAAGPFLATDGTSWVELLQDYVDAYQLAKGDSTKNPELTGPDFAQLKRLAKAPQFTRVLYRARLANMVHHQFHASMEYSLSYFCTKFREFDDHAERIKQAKSGQRPGNRGRYLPAKAEDFGG